MEDQRTDRLSAAASRAAAASVGVAMILMATPHIAGVRSAYTETISEYVGTNVGWAVTAGMWALALGSAALLVGMVRRGVPRCPPAWLLLGGWAIGIAVAAVFPADNGSISSWIGQVHNYAAGSALVALLTTGLVLGKRFRRHSTWAGHARLARLLATTGLGAMAVFLAAFLARRGGALGELLEPLPGLNPVGLIERVVAIAAIGILAVLAHWLCKIVQFGATVAHRPGSSRSSVTRFRRPRSSRWTGARDDGP